MLVQTCTKIVGCLSISMPSTAEPGCIIMESFMSPPDSDAFNTKSKDVVATHAEHQL